MGEVVDEVKKRHEGRVEVLPVFVSVDPARDDVAAMKRYVDGRLFHKEIFLSLMTFLDFHPSVIGLTGSYDAVKSMCKAYRVYFSSPPPPKGAEKLDPKVHDYLVDHSIYFYLMDPRGEFVEAFGKVSTVQDVANRLDEELELWKGHDLGKAKEGAGPKRLEVREYQQEFQKASADKA
jgi:protein SCO1/2